MLFDRPASLPIATMRSHSHMATFASHVRGARASSWSWLRPRVVPVAVAIVGMLAVLGSAEYLTRLARYTPEQPAQVAEQPMQIELEGNLPAVGTFIQLPGATSTMPVRSIPTR